MMRNGKWKAAIKWVVVYLCGTLFSFADSVLRPSNLTAVWIVAGTASFAVGAVFCMARYAGRRKPFAFMRDCFFPWTKPKKLLGLFSMLVILALAIVPLFPWAIPFNFISDSIYGVFSEYTRGYLWNGLAIRCVVVSYATYAWLCMLCRRNGVTEKSPV